MVDFFIRRPVFATVCSLLIILAGPAVWDITDTLATAKQNVGAKEENR